MCWVFQKIGKFALISLNLFASFFSFRSLNLKVKRLGGGYGGKISRSSQIACACALAAHLLNRPVRFVMTLEANMSSIGKRYACINNYEVEFDHDGKIVKLDNDYVQDYGCSLNEMVEGNTSSFFRNCYVKNGWKIKATAAKTDAPSHTWCRAPGTTEGIAMIENIMEHVAHKLEKEPLEVRMANISNSSEMKKMLPEFAKNVGKLKSWRHHLARSLKIFQYFRLL
jgi:xanthine dehydrogenase/oxidase